MERRFFYSNSGKTGNKRVETSDWQFSDMTGTGVEGRGVNKMLKALVLNAKLVSSHI